MKYGLIFGISLPFLFFGLFSKPVTKMAPPAAENMLSESQWVDSVFNEMSDEERLGQLFMIRAHSNLGSDHEAAVKRQIEQYHIGGLCFFQGTPERQIELTNEYQKLTKRVPLLVGMDAEWGLGMRMPAQTISYPRQLALGAIQDNRIIYEMGKDIAQQLRRMGVHVNFAPVADVNNNPNNPVINDRSFGENRYNVTVKCYMYMKGMQDNGVLACAKHFPGHGDTDVDSHKDLPIINHDMNRLDSIELYPFKALVQHGIGSVMVAHLSVPAMDDAENRPTSLSGKAINQLLKQEFGFHGLVFTDALDMQGVTKHFSSGRAEVEALKAGTDMLLIPLNIDASMRAIYDALESGELTWDQINVSVKKVLKAKFNAGLTTFSPIQIENIAEDLNKPQSKALRRKLIGESITLVRNTSDLIPMSGTDSLKLATVSFGRAGKTAFQSRIDDYIKATHYQLSKDLSSSEQDQWIEKLQENKVVIVAIHQMSKYADKAFGIPKSLRDFIHGLNRTTKVVLVLFGSPYSLEFFDDIGHVVVAYDENYDIEDITAQGLFGATSITGRLPVTASSKSKFNAGVSARKIFRLGYALPEETGLNSDTLRLIDKVAQNAVDSGATPGCVVLVAKGGKIVYEKAFGHHTYARSRPVLTDDIFDLASVTKIAATTISLMKLEEEGKISLDAPLKTYLPELAGTNKGELVLSEVMAHVAGLRSWIPFYEETLVGRRRRKRPSTKWYQPIKSEVYSVPVTEKLFMDHHYIDTMWQQMADSELPNLGRYRYSDLGFYYAAKIVERVSGFPLDQYAALHFYEPMDLHNTLFNPTGKIPLNRILPTEIDNYFRKQKIHGYVHDMGAAMLGGVSGHAGLFSNARELAAIMEMLLLGGEYNGHQFLSKETIELFTTRHPNSTRRGIGFDMKETAGDKELNLAPSASIQTFGHLGFTGISSWVDPKYQLIYIFLSNRTYPSMNNYRIGKLDTRDRIHQLIYQALEEKTTEDFLDS